jgi:hypothetical protein
VNAITASVVVSIVGMVLLAVLVAYALHVKGNVRASGRVGAGSFNIETTEKQR